MQAIRTKYLGATNTKPGRIKATSASGLSITVAYRHELNTSDAHKAAALALCKKLGWENELIGGGLSDSEEVFVMIPRGMVLVRQDLPAAAQSALDLIHEQPWDGCSSRITKIQDALVTALEA